MYEKTPLLKNISKIKSKLIKKCSSISMRDYMRFTLIWIGLMKKIVCMLCA